MVYLQLATYEEVQTEVFDSGSVRVPRKRHDKRSMILPRNVAAPHDIACNESVSDIIFIYLTSAGWCNIF